MIAALQINFSNHILEFIKQGGPLMYPLIAVIILATLLSIERLLWWLWVRLKSSKTKRQECLELIKSQQFEQAQALCQQTPADPFLQIIHTGLQHRKGELEAAIQAAAAPHLRSASRNLGAMDTLITLGPLLGLLGTVVGIMGTFAAMGGDELVIDQVTGGIGEALITTAVGLSIAILAVIPANICQGKLNELHQEIERYLNELIVALKENSQLETQATETQANSSTS